MFNQSLDLLRRCVPQGEARVILVCLFSAVISFQVLAEGNSDTVYVSPEGSGSYQGQPILKLQQALNQARRGQTILLAEGTYRGTFSIVGVEGTLESPIVIRAMGPLVVFDGGQSPRSPVLYKASCPKGQRTSDCIWNSDDDGQWHADYFKPKESDFASLKVIASRHIHIEGISVRNSWPTGVMIKHSQFIRITDSSFKGSTHAICALGPSTENLEILNSTWLQDVSKTMWTEGDWRHLHHGLQNYFNGAFLGSLNIKGNVLIKGNTVEEAFNAIRMKVDSNMCDDFESCLIDLNRNVTIEGNRFKRIRDNVVEPENAANDWMVLQNHIEDAHAPISVDNVNGFISVIGNTFINKTRPNPPNNGGKILKLPQSSEYSPRIWMIDNMIDFMFHEQDLVEHLRDRPKDLKKGYAEQIFFYKNTFIGGCPPELGDYNTCQMEH